VVSLAALGLTFFKAALIVFNVGFAELLAGSLGSK
jgi:hypothetical protein